MSKERKRRLTDVNKWKKREFRKMPPTQKLLFMWLCDKCDMSGVVEFDSDFAEFETKLAETQEILNALVDANESIERNGDWIWLRNYAEIQGNRDITPSNNVYKPYYEAVSRNASFFKGLADI